MDNQILGQINKFFDYLFDEYQFTVLSERYFESFGNWVVVLISDRCRLQLFKDRGEISLLIGPLWSPPSWQAGPWYELPTITAYLNLGQYTWDYEPDASTEEQLERLSSILRPHMEQICALFSEEAFPTHRDALHRLHEQHYDEPWEFEQ